ncbi:MAG: hypothetical protein ACLFNS_05505 [Desulfobacterales bacterium]
MIKERIKSPLIPDLAGSETVLLAEDDDLVLASTALAGGLPEQWTEVTPADYKLLNKKPGLVYQQPAPVSQSISLGFNRGLFVNALPELFRK